jgi:hypothetical protein
MKKIYLKPMVEVTQLLTDGIMQDGHSNNMPTAKQGFFDEDDALYDIKEKNLWDDEPSEE